MIRNFFPTKCGFLFVLRLGIGIGWVFLMEGCRARCCNPYIYVHTYIHTSAIAGFGAGTIYQLRLIKEGESVAPPFIIKGFRVLFRDDVQKR